MAIYRGNTEFSKIYRGNTEVNKIYRGQTEVYSSGPNIVTSNLELNLQADNASSYPGTGTTWTDLTGNGYNGTLTNGPTYNASPGYFTLDGVNDTIRFVENSSMINTSNMSIEMWMSVGSIGSKFAQFITNRDGSDYLVSIWIGIDNRQVVRTWNPSGTDTMVAIAGIGTGGAAYYTWSNNKFGTTNGDNNFHHVVATFTSGTLKMYYDGSLVGTNSSVASSIYAGSEYYRIGGEYGAGNYTYNMAGNIGQVRFYHKELSSTEVLQNYNNTKSIYGL